MPFIFHQVDAFTRRPFAGNPAAVFVVDEFPADEIMQQVACEMNLSETAFVQPVNASEWHLRWFTPTAEVDLCGHATLATAHVLFEQKLVAPGETARFHTLSGMLRVRRMDDGKLEMDFPSEPATKQIAAEPIDRAIGMAGHRHAANRMDALVELGSEQEVRELQPDMNAIASLDVRGLIVTAPADDPELDFISRFFGPQVGVPEDPVTGSAHCCLAPWWSERLGKTRMKARQISARGGEVEVELKDDRVLLRGHAVTVVTGTLHGVGS